MTLLKKQIFYSESSEVKASFVITLCMGGDQSQFDFNKKIIKIILPFHYSNCSFQGKDLL